MQEEQGGQQPDGEGANTDSLRRLVSETFGTVVMAMMTKPRYHFQNVASLRELVLNPLLCDHIAIAKTATGTPDSEDMSGIAIWASVSEEVDANIRIQIRDDTWPINLRPEDWNSGSIHWLLDVIAPDDRSAAALIANMNQVLKGGTVKLHPVVASLVNEDTLRQMGANMAKEADDPADLLH